MYKNAGQAIMAIMAFHGYAPIHNARMVTEWFEHENDVNCAMAVGHRSQPNWTLMEDYGEVP